MLNQEIRRLRCVREDVDASVLERIVRPVDVKDLGLVERNVETGEISQPKDANILAYIFLPMALMMLIFMFARGQCPITGPTFPWRAKRNKPMLFRKPPPATGDR